MDNRLGRSADKGKEIAKPRDRSQSVSPEQDPFNGVGYSSEPYGSRSQEFAFNPLDALPILGRDALEMFNIDSDTKSSQTLRSGRRDHGKGKSQDTNFTEDGFSLDEIESAKKASMQTQFTRGVVINEPGEVRIPQKGSTSDKGKEKMHGD